jgi:hypothetical protein
MQYSIFTDPGGNAANGNSAQWPRSQGRTMRSLQCSIQFSQILEETPPTATLPNGRAAKAGLCDPSIIFVL